MRKFLIERLGMTINKILVAAIKRSPSFMQRKTQGGLVFVLILFSLVMLVDYGAYRLTGSESIADRSWFVSLVLAVSASIYLSKIYDNNF
ncbi:MAG: hypothetical protein ACRCYP_05215 [Alphaproteobacteria bacterium]